MSVCFTHLPYRDTHSFSNLITDYLSGNETLQPFYRYTTDIKGFKQAIEDRKKFPVDRKLLTEVLQDQYAGLEVTEAQSVNIKALLDEHTFTVCTAHQPNLLTGYLYFIYKIIHAIKLAEVLEKQFTGKRFVPVYYMGSEDNDLEELGTFRYNDQRFVWDANGQTGAVGRMRTQSLQPLLQELYKIMGPPGAFRDELEEIITTAYLKHDTIASATQYLVNKLFGTYGLLVLNPDDARLKRAFTSIMKDDLLHHTAQDIVNAQVDLLTSHYKAQAYPRPVNLFYLKDDIRERIEQKEHYWEVLNTDIKWDEKAMTDLLTKHPEYFSPNVILRGLFQETILPDIAFIGGGSEVAYWMQLKSLFDHYHVFFPPIHLRQSVLWVPERTETRLTLLGLDVKELFKPQHELIKSFVLQETKNDIEGEEEQAVIEQVLEQLKQKAAHIDSTLRSSAEAVITKIKYQLHVLDKKMLRAEKKKMQDQLKRLEQVKAILFPNNGLQERYENFLPYYLEYGQQYFDLLKEHMNPLQHEFMIVTEKSNKA